MFRSVRAIIGLCILAASSLGVVVGWGTGFFGVVGMRIGQAWTGVTTWLSQPFGLDHLLTGLGVLAAPIILLIVIFAIADD